MTDSADFDEEERFFAEEEDSEAPPSKGTRLVPSWQMDAFIGWVDRFHPEIPNLKGISRRALAQLIDEFEISTGRSSGFKLEEWLVSLRKQ